MEDKKVLLSVKDLDVKFRVRGRVLTAIRNISLDIYENESIAIVGESGSGKSVFTKTFAGLLDTNGFIDNGSVVFHDKQLEDTEFELNGPAKTLIRFIHGRLNRYSSLETGSDTWREILALESEKKAKGTISDEEDARYAAARTELEYQLVEADNLRMTYNAKTEKQAISIVKDRISGYRQTLRALEKDRQAAIKRCREALKADTAYLEEYSGRMAALKKQYAREVSGSRKDLYERNLWLAREVCLSIGRYNRTLRFKTAVLLLKSFREAMRLGEDLTNDKVLDAVYNDIALRVKLLEVTDEKLIGRCEVDVTQIRYAKDWSQVRGSKIATIFQDPMTSLNPVLTIGKQITMVIMKHQKCSEDEARKRALMLMYQVGIPNPENRFDDYPFQYSGGMRQRIVIAIALSCKPRILICDEPTTALDVTIQAQILRLLKVLQKEYGYTIVFITHDLGVVANIADRVAVLYGGQVVEVGTVREVFYDPKHPYTWALLSSLPQLAEQDTELFSITGTPPSLYNRIIGDSFAPRNPYCLKIDTLEEPPMFQVSESHFAKTWLLDPRAPHVSKPETIENIHEKLCRLYNI